MNKSANSGFYRHQVGRLSCGAVLDVGLKCTHSCRFCYYSFLDGSDEQFIGMRHAKFRTLAECKQILEMLKQNGFINFDCTGGEPCLHPDIVEITRYAHQELGLKGRIITLGQWLTEKKGSSESKELIDGLLDAGLTNFLFSFHAANEELFARSTGEKYSRLRKAMCYLDDKGFQYTSNTTVYEWNYSHLPELAREIVRHGIYLHNFIIMNAYYAWNKDGKAFGVQAKYSEIYPYLMEAVDILESNYIGVNIRYAPLCTVRGKEKNLVGMVGVRYDPYEWMNLAGHMGGSPEYCASVIPIKDGEIEKHLSFHPANGVVGAGVKITGTRGNLKYFCEKCAQCGARDVCDGIDPNYLNLYGTDEFTPYEQIEKAPLQTARYQYQPPFLVKTEQFADMKLAVAETFKKHNPESIQARTETRAAEPVKISAIIPCYNYGRYLDDAVQSVISQTWQNFEIIIVNDGSTDDTEQVANDLIKQYPNHRIILINQPNSGQPAISRNTGMAQARGEYVLCLDADDLLAPGMIEECVRVLQSDPSVSIVYTDRLDFGGVDQLVKTHDYSFARLKYANQISYCALFRRKVWEDVGGYRTNVKGCEDWDFWVAAGARGHFGHYLPKPLFMYRRHDTGIYQEVLKDLRAKFSQIVLNNQSAYTEEDIRRASDYLSLVALERSDSPPMVSVIVPTRNRPEMLVEALQSTLDQTFRDFEIIVVNDGGADEIADLIARLNTGGKIRYLKLQENLERSAARNAGIGISRGKYIAYLDDDDIFYPDHLETLVKHLESTGCRVAYSGACLAHQEKENGRYVIRSRDILPARPFDRDLLLVRNFIPILCLVHEKACIEKSGSFDEKLRTHEDWDFWIRLSKYFDFDRVEKVTAEFRRRPDGTTTTDSMRADFLRTMKLVHERYRDMCDGNPSVLEAQRRTLQSEMEAARQELTRLGSTLLDQKEFKGAENAFRQALTLAPQDPALLLNLGKTYYQLRQFADALLNVKLSTRIDPSNSEGWFLLSLAAREAGDHITAAAASEKARSLDPRLPEFQPISGVKRGGANGKKAADQQPAGQLLASIVVTTYNSAGTIAECLESVFQNTPSLFDLIVVDNASTDATRSILKEYHGRITVILSKDNLGFSRACNQAIRISSGKYIVLLNPDTAVTPGWLERMVAHFQPDVGAVGPVSDYVAGLQKVELYLPPQVVLSTEFTEIAHLLSSRATPRAVETKLLIGFCMALPRNVLDEVGLLDEELFLGNDDLDISWRLRLAGYRLLVATDSFVHHEGQVSFKSEAPSRTNLLVQQSTDRLYRKLLTHYGRNVPSPVELWGIDWFKPSSDLLRSQPARPTGRGLTSIIILTLNQLHHTRMCLESLERHTPEAHEIIIVDNGSSDDTLNFLRQYADSRSNVTVIANKENRGFAAGNNQGLALARGDFILLLNNDTVVTDGWLRRMLAVLDRNPITGIVGPRSNYVSGPQLVADAGYRNPRELEVFAGKWAAEHAGRATPIIRVVGFCMLIRRSVVERIGGLDEQFGGGNFEDDDFSLRARYAGFEAQVAEDAFVHHTGNQTFKGANIDFNKALLRNWEIFKAKWKLPAETTIESGYYIPGNIPAGLEICIPLPDVRSKIPFIGTRNHPAETRQTH